MLERVALGVLEVDEDDVGRGLRDGAANLVDVMDHGHAHISCLAQALLDDRGANAVLVDDQDGQVRVRHCRHLCLCSQKAQVPKMHVYDAKLLAVDLCGSRNGAT